MNEELYESLQENIWAKSNPYKPLWMHLLEAGIVAQSLLEWGSFKPLAKELQRYLPLTEEQVYHWVGYMASVHDIGKAFPAFQQQGAETKIAALLKENGLLCPNPDGFRHEVYGEEKLYRIWKERVQDLLEQQHPVVVELGPGMDLEQGAEFVDAHGEPGVVANRHLETNERTRQIQGLVDN